DLGGGGETDLVQAVAAANDEGSLRAKPAQGAGKEVEQLPPAHAHELIGCARRIRQRTEPVEERRHAEPASQLGQSLEGRVKVRGEAEGEAGAIETSPGVAGVLIYADAEGGEDVGAAALAGDGAVAVLDHRHAGGGDDQGGGGADVEG